MTPQTHISYKTAKALKAFLKESAPEPMEGEYYFEGANGAIGQTFNYRIGKWPIYALHDLLSRPFCEEMAKAITHPDEMRRWEAYKDTPVRFYEGGPSKKRNPEFYIDLRANELKEKISSIYYDSGLPAVEKELMRMMEGK